MVSTRTIVVTAGAVAVLAAGLGGYAALRVNDADRRAAAPAPAEIQPPAAEIGQPVPAAPAPATAAEAPAPPAPTLPPAEPRDDRPASPAPRQAPATPEPPPPPATGAPATAAPPTPPATVPPPETAPPPPPVIEPPRPPEPAPRFDELTVKEDSVVGIRLESHVTSETAKVEDRVTARVSRDVTVDGRTAIPSGARLEGHVTLVEQGGRFKERARLGIRFTSLVLADNTRIGIQTETIFRTGEPPAQEAGRKIGASAVVGAILGAVIGGKKGAAVGTAAGAAGGTAVVAAGGRNEASIAAGAPLTVRLTAPVKVLVEKTQ
jgi:hypothetical protein